MFEKFPYTNFHELNLDWILKTVRELEDEIAQIINQGRPESVKTVHIKRDTVINGSIIATNVIYDIDPDATLTFNGDFVSQFSSVVVVLFSPKHPLFFRNGSALLVMV